MLLSFLSLMLHGERVYKKWLPVDNFTIASLMLKISFFCWKKLNLCLKFLRVARAYYSDVLSTCYYGHCSFKSNLCHFKRIICYRKKRGLTICFFSVLAGFLADLEKRVSVKVSQTVIFCRLRLKTDGVNDELPMNKGETLLCHISVTRNGF